MSKSQKKTPPSRPMNLKSSDSLWLSSLGAYSRAHSRPKAEAQTEWQPLDNNLLTDAVRRDNERVIRNW